MANIKEKEFDCKQYYNCSTKFCGLREDISSIVESRGNNGLTPIELDNLKHIYNSEIPNTARIVGPKRSWVDRCIKKGDSRQCETLIEVVSRGLEVVKKGRVVQTEKSAITQPEYTPNDQNILQHWATILAIPVSRLELVRSLPKA